MDGRGSKSPPSSNSQPYGPSSLTRMKSTEPIKSKASSSRHSSNHLAFEEPDADLHGSFSPFKAPSRHPVGTSVPTDVPSLRMGMGGNMGELITGQKSTGASTATANANAKLFEAQFDQQVKPSSQSKGVTSFTSPAGLAALEAAKQRQAQQQRASPATPLDGTGPMSVSSPAAPSGPGPLSASSIGSTQDRPKKSKNAFQKLMGIFK